MVKNDKESLVRCPDCGEKILRKEGIECVLRNSVIIFRNSDAVAKCKQCRRIVKVPIKLI